MNHALEKYTACLTPAQAEIMELLHGEISELPGIVMKERYKLPFYYGRSWICYLNPIKKEGIELAFTRGNDLSNAHEIPEHRTRKQIAGIICADANELPLDLIRDTLFEAIELDRSIPYSHPGKRSRKS
ncbi:MAG: hypothetical protein ABR572_10760 [Cryomorphaceae bacterium]|nr:hypothetical protein [Flavobacteriales bacterium]